MSQIDWSKAPEWATHALVKLHNPNLGGISWSAFIDGEHRVSPDGLWFHPDGYRVAEERPRKLTAKAWTGEGSPPVGTVCEIKQSQDWTEVDVIAHYNGQAVIAFYGDVELRDYSDLRPIRTPEQIAAEAREKAINAMAEILTHDGSFFQDAERLYDAGYRKFEITEE